MLSPCPTRSATRVVVPMAVVAEVIRGRLKSADQVVLEAFLADVGELADAARGQRPVQAAIRAEIVVASTDAGHEDHFGGRWGRPAARGERHRGIAIGRYRPRMAGGMAAGWADRIAGVRRGAAAETGAIAGVGTCATAGAGTCPADKRLPAAV